MGNTLSKLKSGVSSTFSKVKQISTSNVISDRLKKTAQYAYFKADVLAKGYLPGGITPTQSKVQSTLQKAYNLQQVSIAKDVLAKQKLES